jgi:endoglucanase
MEMINMCSSNIRICIFVVLSASACALGKFSGDASELVERLQYYKPSGQEDKPEAISEQLVTDYGESDGGTSHVAIPGIYEAPEDFFSADSTLINFDYTPEGHLITNGTPISDQYACWGVRFSIEGGPESRHMEAITWGETGWGTDAISYPNTLAAVHGDYLWDNSSVVIVVEFDSDLFDDLPTTVGLVFTDSATDNPFTVRAYDSSGALVKTVTINTADTNAQSTDHIEDTFIGIRHQGGIQRVECTTEFMYGGGWFWGISGFEIDNVQFSPSVGSRISGVVWEDMDGNGLQEPQEPPLSGQVVLVEANNSGAGEPLTATTDENGLFEVVGLSPGVYTCRFVVPEGWNLTCPISRDGDLERQYASSVIDFSSQRIGSALQALGPPNAGPFWTWVPTWYVWLPVTDGSASITLGFQKPVYSMGASIFTTCRKDCVTGVQVIDLSGNAHSVWTGTYAADDDNSGPLVISWPQTGYLVNGIRIFISQDDDSTASGGLDAVELQGTRRPGTDGYVVNIIPPQRLVENLDFGLMRLPERRWEFFEDFDYSDITELEQNGWTIREYQAEPGFPGARWSRDNVALIDDMTMCGNRLVELRVKSGGTEDTIEQAEIYTPIFPSEKGTYAARVRFMDYSVQDFGGLIYTHSHSDPIVQTFFGMSEYVENDETFCEADFEYVPNSWEQGGWPRMDINSWKMKSTPGPLDDDRQKLTLPESWGGWHTLLFQVEEDKISYYIDGQLQDTHVAPYAPDSPMRIFLQHWVNSTAGPHSSDIWEYDFLVDWVYYVQDVTLSTSAVENIVFAKRHEITNQLAGGIDPWEANRLLGRGINLGNLLEAPKGVDWGVTLKDEYFQIIKDAGFDSIRIPIRWSDYASNSRPYTIEPSFFEKVDYVITNALEAGLVAVINIHHYEELINDPANHRERFLYLWDQIAGHYEDYPDDLLFELLNEPHEPKEPSNEPTNEQHQKITAELWNTFLFEAVTVIRQTNPRRNIIVGGFDWNSILGLSKLWLPPCDKHIIATFHYYDPFEFTHQGAPVEDVNTDAWIGTKWEGTPDQVEVIQEHFDQVYKWSQENNRPVYIGEFGAHEKADMDSRFQWTSTCVKEAEQRGFSWAYWEFCSEFGAYDDNKDEWTDLLRALIQEAPK